jgi:hypothetical protein
MSFDFGNWDPRDRSQDAPQRRRLEELVRRLTDEQLATRMGEHWTVAVALAHMSFWDRRAATLVEAWRRQGTIQSVGEGVDTSEVLNDALLPTWRALPPRAAAEEAVAAARAADGILDEAGPTMVEQIMSAGPSINPARGIHRAEHLDEIERTLGL